MMRERLLGLAEHRARLVTRAQSERATLSAMLVPADAAASLAASVLRVARDLVEIAGRHPLVVVAGVALLVALRPKRAITWLARGWSLWRLYHGARGWWLRFATSSAATATGPGPAGAPK